MVKGVDRVRRRLRALTAAFEQEIPDALERLATDIVKGMNAAKPIPEITVAWTRGADIPKGAVALAGVADGDGSRVAITIYATASTTGVPGGFPAIARWFEFGTAPRVQKTTGRYVGQITAQPYFYPIYRANKKRVRAQVRAAIDRAVRRINQT